MSFDRAQVAADFIGNMLEDMGLRGFSYQFEMSASTDAYELRIVCGEKRWFGLLPLSGMRDRSRDIRDVVGPFVLDLVRPKPRVPFRIGTRAPRRLQMAGAA